MRGAWIITAALVVCGMLPEPAKAGVYFTSGTVRREFAKPDDPDAQELWPWPAPFVQFQQDLADYRAAAVVKESPLRQHYERRVKELEAAEARGTLGRDDAINLGAYYIRLGQPEKAVRLLEPRAREGHFLLLANLATAHELSRSADGPDLALRYREQALAAWPSIYSGWTTWMLNSYRKAEQYHLKLLTLRQERARQAAGRPGPLQLDNLFPRVRFGGPGGKYEVGGISPAQWGEVPPDASNVVMQLLLWLPFDDGLHWLLGELLNASGDVAGAAAMMKTVVEKPPDPANPQWAVNIPPELREHYQAVSAAAAAREKFAQEVQTLQDPFLNPTLLWALAPRGSGLAGGGEIAREASLAAIMKAYEPAPSPKAETQPAAPADPAKSWLPDWRALAVGFAAGAVVVWLLGYQIRQARRAKV
jgi:tetratricopeptide (TPR) repeat protein